MKQLFFLCLILVLTSTNQAQVNDFMNTFEKRSAPDTLFNLPDAKRSNTDQSAYRPGQFTIKPDNNGQLNFDTTLARNFQQAIDSIRYKYLTTSGISAAMFIPGKGTWLGVNGLSKVDPPENINPEMLFYIGSNTKGFIGTIILKLAEEGKLSLDDSIGSYLPPIVNISGKITIRQLLNMTSGLYDFLNDGSAATNSMNTEPDRIWTPEELLTTFVGPYKALPGGNYRYCNTNLILAGMIIKKITNASISTQLRQRILTPLAMTQSYFAGEEIVIGTIATPWYNGIDYTWRFGNALHTMYWTAGAIVSTAENAVRWSSAFYGGEILTPDSYTQLRRTVPADVEYGCGITQDGYGLTVAHFSFLGKEIWGHTGGTPGYISFIMQYPVTGMSLAVLQNSRLTGVDPYTEATSALLHEYFKSIPSANVSLGKSFVFGGDSARTYDLDISSANLTPMGKYRYGTILNCRIRPGTNELYGISNALGIELVQIDGVTGEAYPRKVIKFPVSIPNIKGMAFQSADTIYIGDYTGRIFKFSIHSGIAIPVAVTGLNIAGLDFDPNAGQLWASVRSGVTVKKDLIYKINLPVGDTVRVGATGFGQITQDIAFDPSGNLYGLIGSGADINRLAQIDTATGVGTIIGSFGIPNLNTFALSGTITSVSAMPSYPVEFTLSQNYPNPFNPTTTIRYSLPASANVKLAVYDLLGREIVTLVNEEQSAGWKEVEWNASVFSSGIYFYKLTAGDYVGVKKFMLLK